MMTYKIDGALYAEMLRSAAISLRNNASTVNELNVFPVPDGDTGENMSRTIEGGAAAAGVGVKSIGEVAAVASRGMLLAARGNSGVILSQFFEGIKRGLVGIVEAGVKELKAAFALGVKQAYSAVTVPTEGTILTVMREATERAEAVGDNAAVEEYFGAFIDEMYASLDRTPELLPVLKESGVVDSGGAGFTYIIEGMLAAVKDEPVSVKVENAPEQNTGVVRNRFERRAQQKERKKFACVTVADGEGLIEQFRSLGADYVIDGKQTMNPSTNDFITAFDAVNADVVFVMPNNSNIILAANQAAELYDKSRVVVIGSKTLAEGYAATSMLDYSSNDVDEIKSAFEEAIAGVTTGLVTYSIRDCNLGGRDIKKGDFLGFADKTPISSGKSEAVVACELLAKIVTEDTAFVIAMRGKNADPKSMSSISEYMQKNAKHVEFYDFDGGQDVYSFIFVVE